MWKKVLVGIPQGFIKITVIYKKAHRNFHGIPLEYFTEFRGILFGIFQTEFLPNSGIPYEKFDGNIIPPEFFFDGIMDTLVRTFAYSTRAKVALMYQLLLLRFVW